VRYNKIIIDVAAADIAFAKEKQVYQP